MEALKSSLRAESLKTRTVNQILHKQLSPLIVLGLELSSLMHILRAYTSTV